MTPARPIPNLVVLRSKDIDRAVVFYQALGFIFIKHRHGSGPEHYSSDIGGFVFEIYPLEANHQPTTSARVGFSVEDVDAALCSLEQAGGRVVSTPKNSEWGRRAVIKDLDGHSVELVAPASQDHTRDDPWGLDAGVTPKTIGGALFQSIARLFRSN